MLICSKIFFIQLFFRMILIAAPDNRKQKQMFSKVLLTNLTNKENLTGVTLLIDTGFARFLYVLQFSVKNFNGFMLKSPILDV